MFGAVYIYIHVVWLKTVRFVVVAAVLVCCALVAANDSKCDQETCHIVYQGKTKRGEVPCFWWEGPCIIPKKNKISTEHSRKRKE